MIKNSKTVPSEEVIELLDTIFLEKENLQALKSWSSEVLDSCNPVSILEFYQHSNDVDTREEVEFSIRLNPRLTNSEILILIIISYYLPHDGGFLLREGIYNIEKKKQLHKDILYRVYISGFSYFLLMIINSNINWRSLSGQIIKMINRIKKELTSSDDNSQKIFLPFWSKPHYDHVERYTGYTKHYKDHGTLRPDSYSLENHLSDRQWQELYTNSIERKRQEFSDSLEFIIGSII